MGKVLEVKVIINGSFLYENHVDAWRAGEVVEDSLDVRGPTQEFVTVVCQPRGRERKVRTDKWPTWWLLKDTPEVREKLLIHGAIVPETYQPKRKT
jgi:hypothetical protein